jgi:hypothetical protein
MVGEVELGSGAAACRGRQQRSTEFELGSKRVEGGGTVAVSEFELGLEAATSGESVVLRRINPNPDSTLLPK